MAITNVSVSSGVPGPKGLPGQQVSAVVQGSAITSGHGVVYVNGKVALADSGGLASGLTIAGLALVGGSAGASITFVTHGPVDPAVYNLGAGVACAVGTDANGKPVRVTDATCVSKTKYLGSCDANGAIFVNPRTVHQYSVIDFGAKADGSDDYAVIQAALDAAKSDGGRTVFFPNGTYTVNSPLVLSSAKNVILRGDTGLVGNSNVGAWIKAGASFSTSASLLQMSDTTQCGLYNLGLDGNSLAAIGLDHTASSASQFCEFKNFVVQNATIGLHVGSSADHQVSSARFLLFLIVGCPTGIYQDGTQTNLCSYAKGIINVTSYGIDVAGGDITTSEIDFEGQGSGTVADVRIQAGALWCRFRDNYHETSDGSSYLFPDSSSRVYLTLFEGVRVLYIGTTANSKIIDYNQGGPVTAIACQWGLFTGTGGNNGKVNWNGVGGGIFPAIIEIGNQYLNSAACVVSSQVLYKASLTYGNDTFHTTEATQAIQTLGYTNEPVTTPTGNNLRFWFDSYRLNTKDSSGNQYQIPQVATTAVTGDYTVPYYGDRHVAVAISSAPITITLPNVHVVGQRITVKDRDGLAATHNITVDGNGRNIDGASTLVISTNYGKATLVDNGTTWGIECQ